MNTGYLSIYLCLYNFFQQCFVAVSIQIFHLLSIRFILEYFLLVGTLSGVSSFLECSLYRIATDFWALILGCTTSLSTFISSNRFFCVWNCYIFVHIKLCHLWTENLTSFWFGSLLILFVVLFAFVSMFSTMLNRSILSLFLMVKEKLLFFHSWVWY